MEEYPLTQSSWGRAKQETRSVFHTIRFWVVEMISAPIIAFGMYLAIPSSASVVTKTIVPIAAFSIWMLAMLGGVFLLSLLVAPYRQRNEARQRVKKLEAEFERPKLFDILCPTTSIGLPLNHREDGTWMASSAQIGPSPITIVHRGDLATVTRVTAAPEVRFIYEDGTGWMSTDAITVTPQRPLPPSMRPPGATDFEWDVSNPSQWVLTGLPLPMAKGELLQLPGMVLSVSDANLAGAHFEKGDKCALTVRLAVRTDKGSQVIPDLSIELTLSDIKNVEWMVKLEEKETRETND